MQDVPDCVMPNDTVPQSGPDGTPESSAIQCDGILCSSDTEEYMPPVCSLDSPGQRKPETYEEKKESSCYFSHQCRVKSTKEKIIC